MADAAYGLWPLVVLNIISHFVADEERFDRIVQLRDGRTVPG